MALDIFIQSNLSVCSLWHLPQGHMSYMGHFAYLCYLKKKKQGVSELGLVLLPLLKIQNFAARTQNN